MKGKIERGQKIIFNVSDEEKDLIVEASQENDMTISYFCRRVLLGFIRSQREDKKEDV